MRNTRTRQLLIVLASVSFAVLLSSNCFAQCITRISGRVTRDGSAPVAHQEMQLSSRGQRTRVRRTNANGYYSFHDVCSGEYTVRPASAGQANPRLLNPYRPPSRQVVVENDVPAIGGIDFERTNPPGQQGPRDPGNFIEDKIKIDESVRSGRDLKLAREIEQYLESTLPCKEHLCDLTIKVRNARVTITGIMGPDFDKSSLNKVGEAIGGVRRLDISGVRSKEQP